MKFSELIERIRALGEKIEEQYGEIMQEDEHEENQLDQSVEWWADYFAQKYNDDNAEVQKCLELADRYKARAAMFEKSAEYRKQGLMVLAKMAGKTIKTAAATVYMSRSNATLEVDDSAVPSEYITEVVTQKVNKKAIEDAIKAGKTFNWAQMREGKEFVVVKK